jgi:hypothetical protein
MAPIATNIPTAQRKDFIGLLRRGKKQLERNGMQILAAAAREASSLLMHREASVQAAEPLQFCGSLVEFRTRI